MILTEEDINNGVLLSSESAKKAEPVELSSSPESAKITEEVAEDGLQGYDIKDPVELLFLLDEDIASGKVKLHPWQIQCMLDFARSDFTSGNPFKAVLRAANGSGKDQFIIAPCAVWLCMRYVKARCVVTSSSGQQLDSQTCTYITNLCNAANRRFNMPLWKVNYRYFECLATGSPIDAFATDEPKKAEGYHPLKSGAKMAILVSEDKSVPDDINIALNRCNGFTHRLHVSTPGSPLGHFYNYCQRSVFRKTFKNEWPRSQWVQYHVTAYDCSHITEEEINEYRESLPGGETGVAFRSIVLAEFGSTEQQVVIPYEYVWKASNGSVFGHVPSSCNDAGVDLSDGGDETVLAVRNGNKLIALLPFKFTDTQDTVTFLNEKFKEYGLNNPSSRINADCGGLGKPMLDQLKRLGWSNIHYIDNRNTPHQPRVYKNRAAELWFQFRKLMEHNEIILLDDNKLKGQLSSRFYKITPENKHQLESKTEARSKGHPSPDRADAVILAFWEYEGRAKPLTVPKPFELPELPPKGEQHKTFTLRRWSSSETQTKKERDYSHLKDLLSEHNQQLKVTVPA